jgi:hypothetical protein
MADHPLSEAKSDVPRQDPIPFRVDPLDPGSGQRTPVSPHTCQYAYAQATVLLDDIADRGRGLLEATAVLADELLQAFGYPKNGLVTRSGDLRTERFTERNRGAVALWAREYGLTA